MALPFRSDSATRLPVGFQIAGPAFSDSAMLDAAHAIERAIGFRPNGAGAAK